MPGNIDDAAAGIKHGSSVAIAPDFKHDGAAADHKASPPLVVEGQPPHARHFNEYDDSDIEQGEYPTEDELQTLRRVSDSIPWRVYTLAFVELVERFSYYGSTVVCRFQIKFLCAVSS